MQRDSDRKASIGSRLAALGTSTASTSYAACASGSSLRGVPTQGRPQSARITFCDTARRAPGVSMATSNPLVVFAPASAHRAAIATRGLPLSPLSPRHGISRPGFSTRSALAQRARKNRGGCLREAPALSTGRRSVRSAAWLRARLRSVGRFPAPRLWSQQQSRAWIQSGSVCPAPPGCSAHMSGRFPWLLLNIHGGKTAGMQMRTQRPQRVAVDAALPRAPTAALRLIVPRVVKMGRELQMARYLSGSLRRRPFSRSLAWPSSLRSDG